MVQRNHSIDMIHGPLAGKIILFALPLTLTTLIQQLFNTIGAVIVGRFAGPDALAAVGSCSYMVNLFINFFVGLSMGANITISNAFGSGQTDQVKKGVHSSIAFSALCGIALAIPAVVFAPALLRMMSVPENVFDMASLYIRVYLLGLPASVVYNFGAAVLRAQGDTQRPLYYLLFSGALNILLSLVFVVVCGMTTDGVALASDISQYLAAGLVIRCLIKETGPLHLNLRQLTLDKKSVIGIVRMGLPTGIENALYAISNMTVQSAINSFGSNVIAGCSAASNLHALLCIPSSSLSQAVLTFSSQNRGARKFRRIDRALVLGLLYNAAITSVLTLGGLFAARTLLSIYVGNETAVIECGVEQMFIVWPFNVLCCLMTTMASVLRGLGYSVLPLAVSILGTCGLRILWVFTVLPVFGTTAALYAVWPASWIVTIIALTIIFFVVRHKVYPKDIAQQEL